MLSKEERQVYQQACNTPARMWYPYNRNSSITVCHQKKKATSALLCSPRCFTSYKPINSPKLNLYTFFFGRPRPLLGACGGGNSSRGVLGGASKAKVGFGAEIGMVAGAEVEVEVGKSSTASRGADGNIENVDIALIAAFLAIFRGPEWPSFQYCWTNSEELVSMFFPYHWLCWGP